MLQRPGCTSGIATHQSKANRQHPRDAAPGTTATAARIFPHLLIDPTVLAIAVPRMIGCQSYETPKNASLRYHEDGYELWAKVTQHVGHGFPGLVWFGAVLHQGQSQVYPLGPEGLCRGSCREQHHDAIVESRRDLVVEPDA